MLRFLTAGESHGRALVVIVEGLPAGLEVTVDDLQAELARRRLGYGRGPRMRFEVDDVTIVSGVRHGRTLGSPGGGRDRQHRVGPQPRQVAEGDVGGGRGRPHPGPPHPAPPRPRRPGRHAEVRLRRLPRRAGAGLGPGDRGPRGGRHAGQAVAGHPGHRRAVPRGAHGRGRRRPAARPDAGRPRPDRRRRGPLPRSRRLGGHGRRDQGRRPRRRLPRRHRGGGRPRRARRPRVPRPLGPQARLAPGRRPS